MEVFRSSETTEDQITIRSLPGLEYKATAFVLNVGNSLIVDIVWCYRGAESSAKPL
jgi:hypothetical protein